jgi:hypothetical protein
LSAFRYFNSLTLYCNRGVGLFKIISDNTGFLGFTGLNPVYPNFSQFGLSLRRSVNLSLYVKLNVSLNFRFIKAMFFYCKTLGIDKIRAGTDIRNIKARKMLQVIFGFSYALPQPISIKVHLNYMDLLVFEGLIIDRITRSD